ncbi:MAG: hypothetical protein ACOCV8_05660, partial [Spirochaetota bacterium]
MPANWADTPEKEKAWKRAKEIFKDQYDKEPSEDSDYAIVMTIAKKIYNKKENVMKNEIIEIKEEVQIGDTILEAGDRVRILKESASVELDRNSIIIIMDALMEFPNTGKFKRNYTMEEVNFVY